MTCPELRRLEKFLDGTGVGHWERRQCLNAVTHVLKELRANYSFTAGATFPVEGVRAEAIDEALNDIALMHQKIDRGAA